MVDKVSVANSALLKLGAALISSLTEDSKNAKLVNACFDRLRDSVLSEGKWGFAIARTVLYPINDVPSFEWSAQFDLPSDCLRPLEMYTEDDYTNIDYAIEGRRILCNESVIRMKYIFRQTDYSKWDHDFAEALAWKIAFELCYAITDSTERQDACDKAYRKCINDVRFFNASQQTVKPLVVDTWTRSRRNGGQI